MTIKGFGISRWFLFCKKRNRK